jgi:His-Xaa-Ser repeat protein HxsA
MKLRFLIPSLLAVGLLPTKSFALPAALRPDDSGKKLSLFDIFKLKHVYTLAAHRSHSSHASHASHSSHYSHSSSTGGGYSLPSAPRPSAPTYVPPPVYTPPPLAPLVPPAVVAKPVPLMPLDPASEKAKLLVIKVQTALRLFGYDVQVDGAVGPVTREALRAFQMDWKLRVTGTITPEVLDALGIPAI